MKSYKLFQFRYIASLFLLAIVIGSCVDDIDDLTVPDTMKRFRPVSLTAAGGEVSVMLTWPEALFTDPGEVVYTIQVAQDSLFSTVIFEQETEDRSMEISDDDLEIQVEYYARIRANGATPAQHSEWVRSLAFQITGEQIFLPTFDNEIGSNTVLLRWRPTANPTRIVLTDPSGLVTEFPISDEEKAAANKMVEGLLPLTEYIAGIFEGTRIKGTTSFVTKEPSIYDIILSPTDNFRDIIEGAENGAMIGLEPGIYNVFDGAGEYANLRIIEKTITLQSVSGDPSDTRVNFKEITFTGNGAGISVNGITFDGLPGAGDYFFNFAGSAAAFTHVVVENCIVENVRVSFMRANRAGNNEHKIELIKVNNSWLRNHLVANYHVFHLDKLEFKEMEVTNSTFSNLGSRGFIGWATNIPMPAPPVIRVENVTINGLGSSNRNHTLLDANNNQVDFRMRNAIVANMALEGQTVGALLGRAHADSPQVVFANSNVFKLSTGGADPVELTFPALFSQLNITKVDLGWTQNTSNMALPAGSPLRTAGINGSPVGDPRWTL
ncbi:DUF4957 domain-containing protein [Anditalea andensis]|uniref:Uncharacterized protein n=1 Tax=Anditalea andensis TaxID=1048983 RepID=A0A074KUU4_9BACT|nr:DUF4957 domain-containing protein [Anditalea andensis]KEO72649.1 hypothetical protein EL17_18085 [Anditalea andensis]